MAYEWQVNGINTHSGRNGSGTLTSEQIKLSEELKNKINIRGVIFVWSINMN